MTTVSSELLDEVSEPFLTRLYTRPRGRGGGGGRLLRLGEVLGHSLGQSLLRVGLRRLLVFSRGLSERGLRVVDSIDRRLQFFLLRLKFFLALFSGSAVDLYELSFGRVRRKRNGLAGQRLKYGLNGGVTQIDAILELAIGHAVAVQREVAKDRTLRKGFVCAHARLIQRGLNRAHDAFGVELTVLVIRDIERHARRVRRVAALKVLLHRVNQTAHLHCAGLFLLIHLLEQRIQHSPGLTADREGLGLHDLVRRTFAVEDSLTDNALLHDVACRAKSAERAADEAIIQHIFEELFPALRGTVCVPQRLAVVDHLDGGGEGVREHFLSAFLDEVRHKQASSRVPDDLGDTIIKGFTKASRIKQASAVRLFCQHVRAEQLFRGELKACACDAVHKLLVLSSARLSGLLSTGAKGPHAHSGETQTRGHAVQGHIARELNALRSKIYEHLAASTETTFCLFKSLGSFRADLVRPLEQTLRGTAHLLSGQITETGVLFKLGAGGVPRVFRRRARDLASRLSRRTADLLSRAFDSAAQTAGEVGKRRVCFTVHVVPGSDIAVEIGLIGLQFFVGGLDLAVKLFELCGVQNGRTDAHTAAAGATGRSQALDSEIRALLAQLCKVLVLLCDTGLPRFPVYRRLTGRRLGLGLLAHRGHEHV